MHRGALAGAGRRWVLEPGCRPPPEATGPQAQCRKVRNLRGRGAADVSLSSFGIDKSVGRCYSGSARLIITNPKREIGLVRTTRGLNEE